MKIKLLLGNLILTIVTCLVINVTWAVDDVAITELQSDVTVTKSKADKNESDIQNLKGGLPVEVGARIAADADLQSQIDSIELTPGPQGPPGPEGPPGLDASLQFEGIIGTLCDLYDSLGQPYPLLCLNCGNGSVEYFEQCDDYNTNAGDGCSPACLLEVCGNGVLDINEQCDDGNQADGDGCNMNCNVEIGDTYTYTSTDIPKPIIDNEFTDSILLVDAPMTVISGFTVTVDITHTWVGDLTIELFCPGQEIPSLLAERRGGGGDNYTATTFDDFAVTHISQGSAPFTGSYQPDQGFPLISECEFPDGIWKLSVWDQGLGDTGTINSWNITVW